MVPNDQPINTELSPLTCKIGRISHPRIGNSVLGFLPMFNILLDDEVPHLLSKNYAVGIGNSLNALCIGVTWFQQRLWHCNIL